MGFERVDVEDSVGSQVEPSIYMGWRLVFPRVGVSETAYSVRCIPSQ